MLQPQGWSRLLQQMQEIASTGGCQLKNGRAALQTTLLHCINYNISWNLQLLALASNTSFHDFPNGISATGVNVCHVKSGILVLQVP